MIGLALIALATWRISSLIVREDGPLDAFARIRHRAGADKSGELTGLAKGISCLWCVSVWVATVLAVLWNPYLERETFYLILSASALAILLDRLHS